MEPLWCIGFQIFKIITNRCLQLCKSTHCAITWPPTHVVMIYQCDCLFQQSKVPFIKQKTFKTYGSVKADYIIAKYLAAV